MPLYKDFQIERCGSYLANSLHSALIWQKVKVGRPIDHPTAIFINEKLKMRLYKNFKPNKRCYQPACCDILAEGKSGPACRPPNSYQQRCPGQGQEDIGRPKKA
jgi:hypothetical protein